MGSFNSNNYVLPQVGGNSGTWGGLINTAFGVVDADFTSIDTRIDDLELKTSNLSSGFTPVTAFIGLSDTPSSLGSDANKFLKINSGGTQIEFVNVSILDLSDTPSSMSSGDAGKVLKVNTAGNGFELATDNSGSGSGGISNVVEDTAPQLGGSLDCQNNAISNAGSLNGIAIPSSGGTFAKTSQVPSIYDSGSNSFTAGTTETKNHGLSAKPDLLQYFIVCTTADFGYSVGDEVSMPETVSDTSHGATLYIPNGSTSQVGIVYPSTGRFQINRKDSSIGNVVATTSGRWNVRIKAVKF